MQRKFGVLSTWDFLCLIAKEQWPFCHGNGLSESWQTNLQPPHPSLCEREEAFLQRWGHSFLPWKWHNTSNWQRMVWTQYWLYQSKTDFNSQKMVHLTSKTFHVLPVFQCIMYRTELTEDARNLLMTTDDIGVGSFWIQIIFSCEVVS